MDVQRAAAVTQLDPAVVADFAERFAAAERPMVLSSWGSNRYLNSDLINRTKLLCLALRGAIGRKGAGYHSTGWVGIDGFGRVANESGEGFWGARARDAHGCSAMRTCSRLLVDRIAGRKSQAQFEHQLARHLTTGGHLPHQLGQPELRLPGTFRADLAREIDPLTTTHHELRPPGVEGEGLDADASNEGRAARAWVTGGSNVRRTNLPQRMLETLDGRLELVVDVNQKTTPSPVCADHCCGRRLP